MAYRKAKPAPVPEAVLAVREELEKRTMRTGLVVPSWVLKDRDLYERVRRRRFTGQAALDTFLADEAVARHRVPSRFTAGERPRKGYDPTAAQDVRVRARRVRAGTRQAIPMHDGGLHY
jgi:hypothetical protein